MKFQCKSIRGSPTGLRHGIGRSQVTKPNVKKEITMKVTYFITGLFLIVLFRRARGFEAEVMSTEEDRICWRATIKPPSAISSKRNKRTPPTCTVPNYGKEYRVFLGRAQYLTGDYPEARQTLQKALSRHRSDNLARLYLGLTLYRLGGQKGGADEYSSRYEWN